MGTSNNKRSRVSAYTFAVISYGVAGAGTVLLWQPFFKYVPFALFFAALSAAAWFGGFGPGTLVALAGAITTSYLMSTPDDIVFAAPSALFVIACLICHLIEDRSRSEQKLHAQLERVNLLHQITRAIGERQDLRSIFQVVIRNLEDHLQIDLSCICLYDKVANKLTVANIGVRSDTLGIELAITEQSSIDIDENGLLKCIRGQLVYEPDIVNLKMPFPQRLAGGGIRSLVCSPLLVESEVFGVLIAARRGINGFTSAECEFLRQLSEHVALAAHQAQLYGVLQNAYEDLRETQQAVTQQERLRALGQMSSGIAHDINNAISPIALYTESLLENEPNLSARARDYLQVIQRAIEDVSHTVIRMREFYRKREPQSRLTPVDLNNLIRQAIELTRAKWSDLPLQQGVVIEVKTERAPLPVFVMGVEAEIREALVNLIFNAVDAMPEGGILSLQTRLTPSAAGSEAPGLVQLEIEDTGIGMDEDTRQHCLEPFFTTKGERGTGLGLPMVFGVVERHSADIVIESAVGRGTTVRLTFPQTASTSLTVPVPAPVPLPPLRILVVDDDPLLLKSLRDILESDGHIVKTANSGTEGINAFHAEREGTDPFAVVITDLGMPYVDGRKVAAAVKSDSPATPVIMLTGWGQRMSAEGDIPPHVDRVLSKPPKLRELRDALVQCSTSAASQPLRELIPPSRQL